MKEYRKRLPNFVAASTHENGILSTRHELARLQVKRTLFVTIEGKGFIMKIDLDLLDRHNITFPEIRFKEGN